MTIEAKPLLENKFWILEREGEKVGTLSKDEDKFILNISNKNKFFNSKKDLKNFFNEKISWHNKNTRPISEKKDVYGYPTTYTPYKITYDIKRKLPLFTKSLKSESLYCAGYYVIYFNKGWVKSFCPKYITIQKNNAEGPFKTLEEAKQRLIQVKNQQGEKRIYE